ncbi:hypothetical protein GUJ93_ZPchr0006g45292 [Zizania palustris]|uniref:C2H2-type domain-containing protein n=1 Tax=Zizania palustris TaxID=103762 RepID=A0A8J5SVI5_ZIZPA|nr:hypothetical protein GUJ93_ZPchr0006g45292 [Zizania palustris]
MSKGSLICALVVLQAACCSVSLCCLQPAGDGPSGVVDGQIEGASPCQDPSFMWRRRRDGILDGAGAGATRRRASNESVDTANPARRASDGIVGGTDHDAVRHARDGFADGAAGAAAASSSVRRARDGFLESVRRARDDFLEHTDPARRGGRGGLFLDGTGGAVRRARNAVADVVTGAGRHARDGSIYGAGGAARRAHDGVPNGTTAGTAAGSGGCSTNGDDGFCIVEAPAGHRQLPVGDHQVDHRVVPQRGAANNANVDAIEVANVVAIEVANVVAIEVVAEELSAEQSCKVECQVCGKRFKNDKSLFGHLRSHPNRGYRGAKTPHRNLNPRSPSSTPSSSRVAMPPSSQQQIETRTPPSSSSRMAMPPSSQQQIETSTPPSFSRMVGDSDFSTVQDVNSTVYEKLAACAMLTLRYQHSGRQPSQSPSPSPSPWCGKRKHGSTEQAAPGAAGEGGELVTSSIIRAGTDEDGSGSAAWEAQRKGKKKLKECREAERKEKDETGRKEKRPYMCKQCNVEFSTHQALGGHMAGHYKDKKNLILNEKQPEVADEHRRPPLGFDLNVEASEQQ